MCWTKFTSIADLPFVCATRGLVCLGLGSIREGFEYYDRAIELAKERTGESVALDEFPPVGSIV